MCLPAMHDSSCMCEVAEVTLCARKCRTSLFVIFKVLDEIAAGRLLHVKTPAAGPLSQAFFDALCIPTACGVEVDADSLIGKRVHVDVARWDGKGQREEIVGFRRVNGH